MQQATVSGLTARKMIERIIDTYTEAEGQARLLKEKSQDNNNFLSKAKVNRCRRVISSLQVAYILIFILTIAVLFFSTHCTDYCCFFKSNDHAFTHPDT